ncbi:MAG: MYG1 family protein [Planctomycetes bacterium]|nr:MYG1 family protein [Planctomycetota bacterium]
MTVLCGTHSGGFHADDVLALALIREFHDREASVVRTRDLGVLARCDLVFDVGGEFDPARGRFDHHQAEYRGDRSSAGMVLDWLTGRGDVDAQLSMHLREHLVDHVDAIDTGRKTPTHGVPCFTSIVGAFNDDPDESRDLDTRYRDAVAFAMRHLRGLRAGFARSQRARLAVRRAMDDAVAAGRRTLFFDEYLPWKGAYFEFGGIDHPSEFALMPVEGAWRVLAIPPEPGSFGQKLPLPASWAGLVDEALEAVTGVPGARFCHKNRFVAVFATRDGALAAMRSFGLGGLDERAVPAP